MLQDTAESYLHTRKIVPKRTKPYDTISYAVFDDTNAAMCPKEASQYHARLQLDGLVQERRNSIASSLKLCFFCTNPPRYTKNRWVRPRIRRIKPEVTNSCHGQAMFIPRSNVSTVLNT